MDKIRSKEPPRRQEPAGTLVTLEDDPRVLYPRGRGAGEGALRSNAEAGHSQVCWPSEPEDQFIVAEIIKLLVKALTADDIWEAMEYLMAVRGLLKNYSSHCE